MTACEILCCEIPEIVNAILSRGLADKLIAFFCHDGELSCVMVNYVTRIIGVLMNFDTNGVYEACMRTDGFVDAVLRQMGMVTVIDVLLGLISVCDPTSEVGNRFLTWLSNRKLIDSLVDLIPSEEYEVSNVASARAHRHHCRLAHRHLWRI